jgi:DMSO reductase anchor subunit
MIMFLVLAAILALMWIGGFTIFHVSSFAIHILIVLAVISAVMHLVRDRRAT